MPEVCLGARAGARLTTKHSAIHELQGPHLVKRVQQQPLAGDWVARCGWIVGPCGRILQARRQLYAVAAHAAGRRHSG